MVGIMSSMTGAESGDLSQMRNEGLGSPEKSGCMLVAEMASVSRPNGSCQTSLK